VFFSTPVYFYHKGVHGRIILNGILNREWEVSTEFVFLKMGTNCGLLWIR
jgi:hypothetical protein